MRLAVFDIDGTLVHGRTTERAFAVWLWRRRILRSRGLVAFVLFLLRYLPRYGRHVTKKNKAWLAGLPVTQIDAEAICFVREEVSQRLVLRVVERLSDHVAAGDRVILLSGTLDCVAAALAKQLGATECIGTTCKTDAGIFGTEPPLRHPFAASKRELVDELCERYGVPRSAVTAYGDSWHDALLLGAVGVPVAVNPDKRLYRIAQENGWEVLQPPVPGDAGNTSG